MRSRLSKSLEAFPSVGILLGTHGGLADRPFLNSFLKKLTLNDPLHEHTRRMHHVGVKLSRLDQLFDFGDSDLRRSRHHRIEIPRGFTIDKVAPAIAFPGLDKSEVSLQRALHEIGATVELVRLFALGDYRPHASGSEECRNPSASGSNSFRKRSLGNKVELHRAVYHHPLQQFIFADVGSNVPSNLTVGQKQSHTQAIDARIVADGGQVPHALTDERA